MLYLLHSSDINTTSLISSNRDSVFYRNYLQYYINTMDKVHTELENYNNEMQMAKSILYTKIRTFVSGLQILSENKIREQYTLYESHVIFATFKSTSYEVIPLFPYIPHFSDNDDDSDICNDENVEVINLDKLDDIYNSIKKDEPIFLYLADKNKHKFTIYSNYTAENKYSILDIDSWFGQEIEYSMIFMFLSSIISIIAFIILMILSYRNS